MKAAFPEDKSDPFDRQRCINNEGKIYWDQKKLSSQKVLVLGVGGIGSCVAFNLARIGVGKITLVDRDVVETTNLNRQMLYTHKDLGKSKAEAAAESLKANHIVGSTEVVWHNLDILLRWKDIVEMAKESTVIFNCVDIGDDFDVVAIELAKSLGIPIGSASSYGFTYITEFWDGKPDSPMPFLYEGAKKELLEKVTPHERLYSYEKIDFLTKNAVPDTRSIGSTVFVAMSGGLNIVNEWALNLMFDFKYPRMCMGNMTTMGPETVTGF